MKETYIIGEIGQNHNGSVDIAKLIVELVARPVKEELFGLELKPMNAVKLTKRDLNEELTVSQMNRIYDTPNSFAGLMVSTELSLNYLMKNIWKYIIMPRVLDLTLSRLYVP